MGFRRVLFRSRGARPRARKVRGGLVDPRRGETRVDLIERLAGAHEAALGEQAAADQTVHLRPHFARLVGDGASSERGGDGHGLDCDGDIADLGRAAPAPVLSGGTGGKRQGDGTQGSRSEEHTSELQSLMRNSYAVFCLKKKKNNT